MYEAEAEVALASVLERKRGVEVVASSAFALVEELELVLVLVQALEREKYM
jgi:hypothetical protein